MYAEKVTLLHVEPTTRCNASCPGCPRNNNGFGVREDLIIGDIDPDIVIETAKQFPHLKVIHLCGNLGDPIAYKHLDSLIDKIISQNEYFWSDLIMNSLKKFKKIPSLLIYIQMVVCVQ